MTNINTTTSIRETLRTLEHLVEDDVKQVVHNVEAAVAGSEEHIEHIVEKDASPIIHKIMAVPRAVGTDITIQFWHAAGEVKRIVVQEGITVESFIKRLREMV